MVQIGYALSSEEHPPLDLVRQARRAEDAGFPFALISYHYHPWVDAQGQSPFVWSVLGAIAAGTERLRVGTGVTCPILRLHPAIVAQAAASTAALMPGRFFLGLGTGERLNEHILGDTWPEPAVRLEMLQEAVEVIRTLWEGETASHYGEYYTVENARLYTLPAAPPPILLAARGPGAARVAGEVADGLINSDPQAEPVKVFEASGGDGKPKYGQLTVCWAATDAAARETAYRYWPNGGLKGPLSTELALPEHFQEAAQMVTEADVAESVVCGPDAERHRAAIEEFAAAGYDHVYVHQVGPDQEGFFRFYEREVLPRYR